MNYDQLLHKLNHPEEYEPSVFYISDSDIIFSSFTEEEMIECAQALSSLDKEYSNKDSWHFYIPPNLTVDKLSEWLSSKFRVAQLLVSLDVALQIYSRLPHLTTSPTWREQQVLTNAIVARRSFRASQVTVGYNCVAECIMNIIWSFTGQNLSHPGTILAEWYLRTQRKLPFLDAGKCDLSWPDAHEVWIPILERRLRILFQSKRLQTPKYAIKEIGDIFTKDGEPEWSCPPTWFEYFSNLWDLWLKERADGNIFG